MMTRPGILIAILLVLGLALVAGNQYYKSRHLPEEAARAAEAQAAASPLNRPRPQFVMRDLEGVPRTNTAWDGKVVLLNFWATWCEPCRREIPDLIALQEEHGEAGLQLVGIAIDEREAVQEYVADLSINYPLLAGEEQGVAVARLYGNDVGILPYTVIIDRQQRVRFFHFGALSKEEMEEAVRPLL